MSSPQTANGQVIGIVRVCDGCQRYARQDHIPAQELRTIPITWPFAVWELDMVGPFSKSPYQKTHLLVAVDKFTEWVEVEPVSRVDRASVVRFFKKIATRFGYPRSIITYNGTNLSVGEMAK